LRSDNTRPHRKNYIPEEMCAKFMDELIDYMNTCNKNSGSQVEMICYHHL